MSSSLAQACRVVCRALPLRLHRRTMAAAPPSLDDIVTRLADPRSRPCPVSHHELLPAAGDAPPFVLSNVQLTAQLLRFASGLRSPQTLNRTRPRPMVHHERKKTKFRLVERMQMMYEGPSSSTFRWHLLHAVAPLPTLRAAMHEGVLEHAAGAAGCEGVDDEAEPARPLSRSGGAASIEALLAAYPAALQAQGGAMKVVAAAAAAAAAAEAEAEAEAGARLPPTSPRAAETSWTCSSCGTVNAAGVEACGGPGCREYRCGRCGRLGHASIFCDRGGGAMRRRVPAAPALSLPPFSGPIMGALGWAEDVCDVFVKGANSHWLSARRASLAVEVLLALGRDGRVP